MNSPASARDQVSMWISDSRNKGFVIGIIVLVAIVLLQANNLKPKRSMCQLFAECHLRSHDVHRMQIALSRSGLNEFEVEENRILVPKDQQARYLQALSEQNAIPTELQTPASQSPTNPFLTHSQQLAIQKENRSKKLREMIMLLPFVEQAWLELDESQSRHSRNINEKSAVVTIRPKGNNPLIQQNLHTLRQIVMGAISGLNQDQIVIVDLNTGFADRGNLNGEIADQRLEVERVAFNKKFQLETRLRESLKKFPGIQVSVVVETNETNSDDKTASKTPTPSPPKPRLEVAIPSEVSSLEADSRILHGANGQVSLNDFEKMENGEPDRFVLENEPAVLDASNSVAQIHHLTSDSNRDLELNREKFVVIIDIPHCLLVQRAELSATNSKRYRSASTGQQNEELFTTIKAEIDQVVRPILANQTNLAEMPIVYNLIDPVGEPRSWQGEATNFLKDNWPSVGVLLIGLVLIGLVTQSEKPKSIVSQADSMEIESPATIPMNSIPKQLDETESAKARLSQMIEKDPETAARVIENWIRDAA